MRRLTSRRPLDWHVARVKAITPETLLTSLREGVFEVRVEKDVADRARRAIEHMVAIS